MSRTGLWRLCVSLALSFVLLQSTLAAPPQTATPSPQAVILLQKSLATLVGQTTLSDVTLTGSVRRIVGGDDQSGSATLKALSSGVARADLALSSGTTNETLNLSSSELAGSWSGPDGTQHPIPYHNLLSEPAWFFPTFAISRRLSTGYIVVDLGPTTYDGQQVEHLSTSQNSPLRSSASRVPFQHLSQVDFYLDSTTLLPFAISFNIHPDNDALIDIPVEIRFSDYRPVSGAQVPFHIQKSINGSLFLDIQIQNATTNSGLSAASFTSL